jgi:hypothetical protein
VSFEFRSGFSDRNSAILGVKIVNGLRKKFLTFGSSQAHCNGCILIVFTVENASTAIANRVPVATRMNPPTRQGGWRYDPTSNTKYSFIFLRNASTFLPAPSQSSIVHLSPHFEIGSLS